MADETAAVDGAAGNGAVGNGAVGNGKVPARHGRHAAPRAAAVPLLRGEGLVAEFMTILDDYVSRRYGSGDPAARPRPTA